MLFTDTVGFIQKLPTELVAAFRATLEEVAQASLLLHVVDAAAPDHTEQEKTVLDVIKTLGADRVPILTAYNKADKLPTTQQRLLTGKDHYVISSHTGLGLMDLFKAIETKLDEVLTEVTFENPHTKTALTTLVYQTAHILNQKSTKTPEPGSMCGWIRPIGEKCLMTLANIITVGRRLWVPPIVIGVLEHRSVWVYVLLGICMITDFLDGLAARQRGERTRLGAFLDPMADKLLLGAVYTTLAYQNVVPMWIFVVIFSRDLLIVLGWSVIYILTGAATIEPRMLGKITTAIQMATAFVCITKIQQPIPGALLWLTLAATAASAIDYVIVGEKKLGSWT